VSLFTEEIGQYNKRVAAQAWDRSKLGLELRQKYEMYFVALAFTLAGLAVQSAKPSAVQWLAAVEVAGWLLLASAGCVGLWRVSRMWLVLVGEGDAVDAAGNPGYASRPKAIGKQLEALERRIRALAIPQFVLFAAGLALLMVSRAWGIFAVAIGTS
jgi:hypothetical protein